MKTTPVLYRSIRLIIFLVILSDIAVSQSIIPGNISIGEATGGGLDGTVIRVTTLAASGPGSLREAIETAGPRIVVFEVGGVIDLNKSRLDITEPYLTLAGQTAPSPGITLIRGGIGISTHDVILRHIRVRPGDAGQSRGSGWEPDGLATSGGGAYNIIIDHCSFSWAVDENLSASGTRTEGPDSTSHRITFSNNIIAEGLSHASHAKGPHSKGTLIHDFCRDIAIVGNLYAHNAQRNPYFKAFTTGIIVNNLIYNPGSRAIQLDYVPSEWKGARYEPENCRVSIVGNVLFKGSDSRKNMSMIEKRGDAYLKDNLAYDRQGNEIPLTGGEINILQEKPVWPAGFQALPAREVTRHVLRHAGARPGDRDDTDRRIIQDFLHREGRIIDSQEEVGGYPDPAKTFRKLNIPDTDKEGWLSRLDKEVGQHASPISISLQRPNFATMVNERHGGNRIGYRFHEHSPISYGKIPEKNEAASYHEAKVEKWEKIFSNASDVFIYKHQIEQDSLWSKQEWIYYLRPVQDGVEMLMVVQTFEKGLPEYYGVQQCFRMSGNTNQQWRRKIADTPAFSEYDLWKSQPPGVAKKSLTYVVRDHHWQPVPAGKEAMGARTPLGIEIDEWRTNGRPMETVGPYHAKMLEPVDNGLIIRTDLSGSWVCGIHWQNTSHVTNHHPADCLHSILNIGNIPPFSKRALLGKIYWFEGSKEDLFDRYRIDFLE